MNNFRWCETITAMSSGSRVQTSRSWMSLLSKQGWSSALWRSQGAFKEDLPQFVPVPLMSMPMKVWCRNKHARPKRNSEYFFTIRLFPTHQTTSYHGPIVLYIDLLAIVPGDELAMIIRRKKRKKKTHLSQEVHQLNWLLTTNTKSQAIGGDILPNLMPISVKFTLS